jgi:hypothetical protein
VVVVSTTLFVREAITACVTPLKPLVEEAFGAMRHLGTIVDVDVVVATAQRVKRLLGAVPIATFTLHGCARFAQSARDGLAQAQFGEK